MSMERKETPIETSSDDAKNPASPYFRYVHKITQLSVQLADALSKNDALTKERDEAKEEIRRLRRAQYNQKVEGTDRATHRQGRRKSDPGRTDASRSGRRMVCSSDGSRSSFSSASSVRQLLISNLQSEEVSSSRSEVALRNLSQTASSTSSLGSRVSSNCSLKSLSTYDELNARFDKILSSPFSNNQEKTTLATAQDRSSLPILTRKISSSNSTVSTGSLSLAHTSGIATSPAPTHLRRGSSRSSTTSSLSSSRKSTYTDMGNRDDLSLLVEGEITWGKLKY